jgi:FKBP-type peptidyl-prolyl cis-trans isomerase SlyD
VNIEDNRAVSIHYQLTGDGGEVIDSSTGREPPVYLHGARNLIPGLERALTGRTVGDRLQVVVQPKDGYGDVDAELIQTVPLSAFQGVGELQPGMHLQAAGQYGREQRITVEAVGDESVTVNGNHPLAGKVLNFDVTVEAVRAATAEETAHGHAH